MEQQSNEFNLHVTSLRLLAENNARLKTIIDILSDIRSSMTVSDVNEEAKEEFREKFNEIYNSMAETQTGIVFRAAVASVYEDDSDEGIQN